LKQIDLSSKTHLVIVPETKTKPFLVSDIFTELMKLVDPESTLISYVSPIFGVVPAEISDTFPVSQITHISDELPEKDFVLNVTAWERIDIMNKSGEPVSKWLAEQLRRNSKHKGKVFVSSTYRSLKRKLSQV
ncbi:MAG: DUF5591 domain-containing protein, partial [Nitrososphaerota archaeon]|nr:DUF5591 domain-containing protein [Nitrososphaerota archaeon]